jgi:hypothetical protein
MRLAQHGERQGRGDPAYTVRPFDTLRDRMQPTEGYSSKSKRILWLIFFAFVITVIAWRKV